MCCLAGVLTACEPDLDANAAAGCDERTPCGEGASCYRGLCVPDELDASAVEPERAEAGQSSFDDASGLTSTGSSVEGLPDDAGELADADDEGGADAGEGSVQDAGARPEPEPAPDAARPLTAPDASASATGPAARPAPDAGRPAVGPRCTLALCCDEARKAYESNQKLDGRLDARKGKCGCGDPDLFRLLGCASPQRPPP